MPFPHFIFLISGLVVVLILILESRVLQPGERKQDTATPLRLTVYTASCLPPTQALSQPPVYNNG